MNAFVFATDQRPQNRVRGKHPAFLPLENRPLLLYVLMALDRVEAIQKITVIGPPKEVMRAVESVMFVMPFQKQIVVLEPRETLLESLEATVPGSGVGESGQDGLSMISDPALYLPGNIPFVTTAEISTFIASADMRQFDCCVSYASANAYDFLGSTQPQVSTKFKTAYHLEKEAVHLGRLFLARPGQMGHPAALKKILTLFQSRTSNAPGDENPIESFLKLAGFKLEGKGSAVYPGLADLAAQTSAFLKTRVQLIQTQTGGHALPVEDGDSHRFIADHFEAWRQQIAELKSEQGEKICSISGTVCDSEKTE
ncbi:MAG: hypothetical protein ACE5F7_08290 [Nitrospiria bacterium]